MVLIFRAHLLGAKCLQVMEMDRSYQGCQSSGTGRPQVPKYHAKNHGRRDGHALRPEAGVTSPAHPWRKRLGDCWGKCKQIQAVNRTLFTVDYYYKNRCIYIDILFAFICRWLRATNSCHDLRPQLFHRGFAWVRPRRLKSAAKKGHFFFAVRFVSYKPPASPLGKSLGIYRYWKSNPMKC